MSEELNYYIDIPKQSARIANTIQSYDWGEIADAPELDTDFTRLRFETVEDMIISFAKTLKVMRGMRTLCADDYFRIREANRAIYSITKEYCR